MTTRTRRMNLVSRYLNAYLFVSRLRKAATLSPLQTNPSSRGPRELPLHSSLLLLLSLHDNCGHCRLTSTVLATEGGAGGRWYTLWRLWSVNHVVLTLRLIWADLLSPSLRPLIRPRKEYIVIPCTIPCTYCYNILHILWAYSLCTVLVQDKIQGHSKRVW